MSPTPDMSIDAQATQSAEAAQAALHSRVQLQSFDPQAMRIALQAGELEHVQLAQGVFEGAVIHTATSRLRTDWGRYNLPVQGRGGLGADMLTVGLLIGGHGAWRIQGAPAASGDMVLFGEGGELLINLPAQAEWLAMQIPRERLEAVGIPLGRLRGASAWRMSALPGDAVAWQPTDVATALAPSGTEPPSGSSVQCAQEQVFAALLFEWERRRAKADQKPEKLEPSERWRVVRRAEAYIEAQPGATLRVDDLCAAACTSLSTLERAFNEVFGFAPRQYLLLRRLAGVRNELLNGNPDNSVTEIATRWGFYHLGRFAQEYGRLYRERPSQTRDRRILLA